MKEELKILEIVQEDCSVSNSQIAAMIGSTEQEVARLIDKMKSDGIILRSAVLVNTEKMGDDAVAEALIEVQVQPERDYGYNDIARKIYKFPEVKAVYLMSGRYDLAVKVEAKTMKSISQFVWEKLSVLDGVSSTQTLFIMRKYKEFGNVLVEEEKEDRLVITP
jgi:DNA-binding Lrp family transcriptional regulator